MVWSRNLGFMGGDNLPDLTGLISASAAARKFWKMNNTTKAFTSVDIPSGFYDIAVMFPYKPYCSAETPGLVGSSISLSASTAPLQIYNALTGQVHDGPQCVCCCVDTSLRHIYYGVGTSIFEYDPETQVSTLKASLNNTPQFIFCDPSGHFYYISKGTTWLYKHVSSTDQKITLQSTEEHPLNGGTLPLAAFHYNASLDAFVFSQYNNYVYLVDIKKSKISKFKITPLSIQKWYGLALSSDHKLAASWYYNGDGGHGSAIFLCDLTTDLELGSAVLLSSTWNSSDGSFGLTYFEE
ncbi:MAG: hypothetical protein ACNI27_07220 [Desulfovibrio sp.]